jgi:hypothetical protein
LESSILPFLIDDFIRLALGTSSFFDSILLSSSSLEIDSCFGA